jgi:hypothetical protein
VVAFRVATARDVTYRQVMPGALAAAIVWQQTVDIPVPAAAISLAARAIGATGGRASFFLPVLGFVLVDDPGCPAATASELQLVFGGALPACCVVNGFVNETRRNCRDSVRRGAMAGMGD